MSDQFCPKCGKVSPPSAQRCDCGWNFEDYVQDRPYAGGSRVAVLPIAISGALGACLFGLVSCQLADSEIRGMQVHGPRDFFYLIAIVPMSVIGFLGGAIAGFVFQLLGRNRPK